MKKLVFIIILSVSGMTFAQDLMWGLTVDAAMKKQDDVFNYYDTLDFNNSFFLGLGGHINYRIFRQVYLQSGIMVHYNKYTDYIESNYWWSGGQYRTISTNNQQFSLDIPIQISLKVWKGLSVYSGISLSEYFSTSNKFEKYFTNNNELILENELLSDKERALVLNKTPFGLQYAFSNGLTIGVNKQVLRLGHSYENSIETDYQMNYYTLRLSYDIGQYEWQ